VTGACHICGKRGKTGSQGSLRLVDSGGLLVCKKAHGEAPLPAPPR
jgi:hypothetical protein